MNETTVRKLVSALTGTACFMAAGAVIGLLIGAPMVNALILSLWMGLLLSLFEVFAVNGQIGTSFRRMAPIVQALIYALVVLATYVSGLAFLIWIVVPAATVGALVTRIPYSLPAVFAISTVVVLVLRIVSFLGTRNLMHLITGRYRRPQFEQRIFLFIDLKNSTAITEQLGALRAGALISDFIFDVSKPITDRGGDIYKYAGDGLIALWSVDRARSGWRAIQAVTEITRTLDHRREFYHDAYQLEPEFRAGLHVGEIVACEQGDLRRSIEYNGDAINIAARLEQKAKELGETLVFSGEIAAMLDVAGDNAHRDSGAACPEFISEDTVKGYSKPIQMYRLRQS